MRTMFERRPHGNFAEANPLLKRPARGRVIATDSRAMTTDYRAMLLPKSHRAATSVLARLSRFRETGIVIQSTKRIAGRNGAMNAEELKEFLAAMELVRQANTAFAEVMGDLLDQNDDLDHVVFSDLRQSVTLH
jgi:hypothetical protein